MSKWTAGTVVSSEQNDLIAQVTSMMHGIVIELVTGDWEGADALFRSVSPVLLSGLRKIRGDRPEGGHITVGDERQILAMHMRLWLELLEGKS